MRKFDSQSERKFVKCNSQSENLVRVMESDRRFVSGLLSSRAF